MVHGGKSVYGLVKNFYRVHCTCECDVDLVVVTWFPFPTYPDRDPLTVRIDIRGLDVNTLPDKCVVPLYHLQPCRVAVEIDSIHHTMYMLRLEGLDTNPLFL